MNHLSGIADQRYGLIIAYHLAYVHLFWVIGGSIMRNGHAYNLGDYALWDSLSTIRRAQVQLHLLNGEGATPTAIASRIQLCDILLGEISGIRSSLARHLERARATLLTEPAQLHS